MDSKRLCTKRNKDFQKIHHKYLVEKEKSLPLDCRRMRRFANREQIQVSAPIGCLFFFSYRDFSEGDVDL